MPFCTPRFVNLPPFPGVEGSSVGILRTDAFLYAPTHLPQAHTHPSSDAPKAERRFFFSLQNSAEFSVSTLDLY
jgi:hypothetical protein